MKRRLKEMEEEAAALRDMQAKVAKEMQGCAPHLSDLTLSLLLLRCIIRLHNIYSICFVI
jgi:hypothetical protein